MKLRYLLILLLFYSIPTLSDTNLSTFDNTLLSPIDERELGQAFMREIRKEIEVIDDVEINEYFNTLAYHLASYSSNPQQFFLFFIVKEPTINAFAFPDGFIGFNSGLILETQNEEELASVLAHEIAHVNQRHSARQEESMSKLTLPGIAASLASILLGGVGPALVSAAYLQQYLDFTRTHEKEADNIGMQTLSNAGFNPLGMPAFFERLQKENRFRSDDSLPEFLRTHPVTVNRIADARSRAEQLPKKIVEDTPQYHLMKAKLLVLTDDNPAKLERKLQTMLETGRYKDERAVRYALALILLQNQKSDGVQAHIDWLMKNDADRLPYRLLESKLAIVQKDNAKASKIYEDILRIYPNNFLTSVNYAEHLLQINDFKNAKKILLRVSTDSNPYYYYLLSQAHEKTGEKAEAYLALTEYHYMRGELNTAFQQIRQARQLKDVDFYTASRIESRYKVIESEFHEQQNDRIQKEAQQREREEERVQQWQRELEQEELERKRKEQEHNAEKQKSSEKLESPKENQSNAKLKQAVKKTKNAHSKEKRE